MRQAWIVKVRTGPMVGFQAALWLGWGVLIAGRGFQFDLEVVEVRPRGRPDFCMRLARILQATAPRADHLTW